MSRSPGTCMTMGSASTFASVVEAMGLALSYNATIPAVDSRRRVLAHETGRTIVDLARRNVRLSDIVTRDAFENAIKVIAAIGGSTNAVLHLLAIAGRLGAFRCRLRISTGCRRNSVDRRSSALGTLPDGGSALRRRPARGDEGNRAELKLDVPTASGRTHRETIATPNASTATSSARSEPGSGRRRHCGCCAAISVRKALS
jgi:hypothetical protein